MKLYTEEQVKSAFRIGLRENYIDEQDAENFANKGIKYLTPIELPSDEEIEQYATLMFPDAEKIGGEAYTAYTGMKSGAKWMREQILQQNIG